MTWESALGWARTVYSIGLLAMGVAALIVARPAVRVLRELIAALGATAAALRSLTGERDMVERIGARTERIEAKIEALHAEVRAGCGRRAP